MMVSCPWPQRRAWASRAAGSLPRAGAAALGEEAFAAARAAGRALPPEAVLAEATALATALATLPLVPEPPLSDPTHCLTPRELDVLRLIADGRSDQEIAAALALSRRTVTSHVTSILTKLGLPSRAAAAAHAVRHGLA